MVIAGMAPSAGAREAAAWLCLVDLCQGLVTLRAGPQLCAGSAVGSQAISRGAEKPLKESGCSQGESLTARTCLGCEAHSTTSLEISTVTLQSCPQKNTTSRREKCSFPKSEDTRTVCF